TSWRCHNKVASEAQGVMSGPKFTPISSAPLRYADDAKGSSAKYAGRLLIALARTAPPVATIGPLGVPMLAARSASHKCSASPATAKSPEAKIRTRHGMWRTMARADPALRTSVATVRNAAATPAVIHGAM